MYDAGVLLALQVRLQILGQLNPNARQVVVSQLGGRSIPYWSRRIFPAAAAIWILLAVIDRKVGTHTPRSINFVLVGVALLTFPAGVAEL